jgi:hypothetical protein
LVNIVEECRTELEKADTNRAQQTPTMSETDSYSYYQESDDIATTQSSDAEATSTDDASEQPTRSSSSIDASYSSSQPTDIESITVSYESFESVLSSS